MSEENLKIEVIDNSIPSYLQKDFRVELNYKLWSTKGARFAASRRNQILSELSNKTIGLLSAYLIIINLVNIYSLSFIYKLDNNTLGFISTAISILILIFSQFENSKNYSLKSEKYHQCSLEIASLYNDLRMLKKDTISLEIEESIRAISKRYEEILFKYENHISIDFKMFKTEKPVYHKLSNTEIITIRLKHYFQVRFIYHFFIFLPIILFIVFSIKFSK